MRLFLSCSLRLIADKILEKGGDISLNIGFRFMRLFLSCSLFGLGFRVLICPLLSGITEVYVTHKLVHEGKKKKKNP